MTSIKKGNGTVIRVHKSKDYTVMSNHHFKNKKLSFKAKGLLSTMLSLPEDWDYSESGLSSLSVDGRAAIRSGLKELEEEKYLRREQLRDGGMFVNMIYHISETPLFDKPTSDKPTSDKPTSDNQHNKVLNNKVLNELSTKEYKTYGQIEHFNEFWKAYPNKKNKKKAKDKYLKDVDKKLHQIIMKDLNVRKKSKDWTKDNGKYIPHPTTYLNGERWNDEIETNTNTSRYDLPIL